MASPKARRLAAFDSADRSISGRHNDWDRMTPFTRYDPATGEIIETGDMSVAALDRLEAGGWTCLRQKSQPAVHYVDISGEAPRRRCRKACPAVLTGSTFSNLPSPCTVMITDETFERTCISCDDQALALTFDYPGTYVLTVRAPAYTDGVFTIEA